MRKSEQVVQCGVALPFLKVFRDKETLRHVRSYDTRILIKVFSVRCKDEPCEDYL